MNIKLPTWLDKQSLPSPQPPPPSSPARKIRRALGIFFLLLLTAFLLWRMMLHLEVRGRFAKMRAGGFPISGAELNTWRPVVADAENGAFLMAEAFALVRPFPSGRSRDLSDSKFLARARQWSPEELAAASEYVRTNAAALAKAHEALQFPRFRYPADFSYGPDTALPHLTGLKKLGQIAALQTALDAEQGRTNELPEHLELPLRFAATLDGEPATLSQFVRSSLVRQAVIAAERSLNRAGFSEDACARLQEAFARAGATNMLALAFIGERAMLIPAFRLSRKEAQSFGQDGEPDAPPRKPQQYSGVGQPLLRFSGFFERDLSFFLKTMEESISLAALPPPKNLALTNSIDAAGLVARKRLYILSSMLLPAYTRIVLRDATTQAQTEAAATALAVERFRRARGRLPEDLKELVPQFLKAIPTDPFDGTALRYRRLPHGYVIYSVGPDGHDDNGREMPDRKKSFDTTPYDVTFTVER